jgi:hypothetical protein
MRLGFDSAGDVFVTGITRRDETSSLDYDFYTLKLASNERAHALVKTVRRSGRRFELKQQTRWPSTWRAATCSLRVGTERSGVGGRYAHSSKYSGTDGTVLWKQRYIESSLTEDAGQAIGDR